MTTRLRRAVLARDRCCVFPGCHRTRVEIHHRKPWAEGGATELDNLDPLCPYHHWLVHEGEWSMVRDGSGRVVFRRPDGTTLDARPACTCPHDGEIERRNLVAGITITPTTVQTAWAGEPLNLGWAIGDLCRTRNQRTASSN